MRSAPKNLAIVLIAALVPAAAAVAETPAVNSGTPAIDSEQKEVLYAIGIAVSRRLGDFNLTEEEMLLVQAGVADGGLGRTPRVDMASVGPRVDAFLRSRVTALAETQKQLGREYCDNAAREDGAVKADSGMIYTELQAGSGASPSSADQVRIHYHGTLIDATVFDSTRGKDPVQFAVGGVIPCFGEGLQRMKVGGKSRMVCPSDIAYGDRGSPPLIRPGATIVFEVELLEVISASKPAP